MQKTICQRIFQECSGVSHGSPISLRSGLSTSCVVRMKYHTEESRELLAILIILKIIRERILTSRGKSDHTERVFTALTSKGLM